MTRYAANHQIYEENFFISDLRSWHNFRL